MDIDSPTPTHKRTASDALPSTSNKRTKALLSDDEFKRVNVNMSKHNGVWQHLMIKNDDSAFILWALIGELASTGLRDKVAMISSINEATEIVESFSEGELNEWNQGVQKSVETGDWSDLIAHRRLFRILSPVSLMERYENEETMQDPGAKEVHGVGTYADLVEFILRDYMRSTSDQYARYVPHIQSSGTGKSRVHDELARRMFYIPLNLASDKANSYPPPDPEVREWFKIKDLTSIPHAVSQAIVQDRCNAFLHALLSNARDELTKICGELSYELLKANAEERLRLLSCAFRDKMAEGGTFESHGAYRSSFYKNVIQLAKKFSDAPRRISATFCRPIQDSETYRARVMYSRKHHRVDGAQYIIFGLLRPWAVDDVIENTATAIIKMLDPCPQPNVEERLLIVLCWDESHSLTDDIDGVSWTRLRRSLQKIKDLPIFSVFLSTAGTFHRFSPNVRSESSNRLTSLTLQRYSPITEVGFDEFAAKVHLDGTSELKEISSTYNIAHLGRSLFATRYDSGKLPIKKTIVDFALNKLLSGQLNLHDLKPAETLACLAVRLGLDFKSTTWTERQAERTQVERHMRLCLAATAGFHNMVTISPSEPLLAEAAHQVMSGMGRSPEVLLEHIDQSYLNPGDRGEVIGALLLLLARDKAIRDRKFITTPEPIERMASESQEDWLRHDGFRMGRIATVLEFLDALLPSDARSNVRDQKPFRFCAGKENKKLADAFVDAYIWFNHFIKVNDFKMVNRENLWILLIRGAAIICANNQRGIDILIPILFGRRLKREHISAMFIQIKNDFSFTTTVRTSLFTVMDPFKVGFLSKGTDAPFPIIRMVFALASKESVVRSPPLPTRSPRSEAQDSKAEAQRSNAKYTAYDIWIAGATNKSFGVINENQCDIYKKLLERSCNVFNGYDLFDKVNKPSPEQDKRRTNARRKMHPGAAPNNVTVEVELDDSRDDEDDEEYNANLG